MISRMTAAGRRQQRYDQHLRDMVFSAKNWSELNVAPTPAAITVITESRFGGGPPHVDRRVSSRKLSSARPALVEDILRKGSVDECPSTRLPHLHFAPAVPERNLVHQLVYQEHAAAAGLEDIIA